MLGRQLQVMGGRMTVTCWKGGRQDDRYWEEGRQLHMYWWEEEAHMREENNHKGIGNHKGIKGNKHTLMAKLTWKKDVYSGHS